MRKVVALEQRIGGLVDARPLALIDRVRGADRTGAVRIFRVVQEQTSNILKYSQAKTVKILINETGGKIHLVISDDGVGF